MLPAEFLATIWPRTGLYVLATPYKIPGSDKFTFAHKVFDDVNKAAAFAVAKQNQTDIYYGVHSLKQERLFNPSKRNSKTGELGAYEVRTQANSHSVRCFYLDLDVGESTSRVTKHASQAEALARLRVFCEATKLSKPFVLSSGSGLHVYWVLTDDITSDEWRAHAQRLKALAAHHGLRADPARTSDSASVLRVAGTLNHKTRPGRFVTPISAAVPFENRNFFERLDAAMIATGAHAPVQRLSGVAPSLGLKSNTGPSYDGPPTTLQAVLAACEIMQDMVRARGNASEPEWYHTLNLVRFLDKGHKLAHKVSEGHPGYDLDATDAKLAQLEAKGIQPTSCLKLAEVTGNSAACARCPFEGKVKSPIVAARHKDQAPPPIITPIIGVTIDPTEIPPPPRPFMRTKDGNIVFSGKNKEGDEVSTVIYDNDIFPLRRLTNVTDQKEQQGWRVVFKRGGSKDFILDSHALYDHRMFVTTIANQGIYPSGNNVRYLQDYMTAYIAQLQRMVDAETQNNHLGWSAEFDQFILPDKVLHTSGKVTSSALTTSARNGAAAVHKRGTLERQVELLKFFHHPAYVANQFVILAGLAAPLFYMTEQFGAVINAQGDPGASKSTAVFTAASFWGDPTLYTINGTPKGMTAIGQQGMIDTLANLPICVDEITLLDPKPAREMVMGISQRNTRGRADRNGDVAAPKERHKSTIMLTNANTSLHGLLATNNSAGTAGAMRIMEIFFPVPMVHTKQEADDYLRALNRNYGHVGEVFIKYVIEHRAAVEERMVEMIREVDATADIKSGERFWSALIAAVLVAGEIAVKLGLVLYDVKAIAEWVYTRQIPHMRGVVVAEYSSPLGVLTDYLETIHGDILTQEAYKDEKSDNTYRNTRFPRGKMLGHYDMDTRVMWILRKGFRDYCSSIGANSVQILDDLHTPRLDKHGNTTRMVSVKSTRKTLGAGTVAAKAQSWCFAINMNHPEISGVIDATIVADNPAAVRTPPKAKLEVVT